MKYTILILQDTNIVLLFFHLLRKSIDVLPSRRLDSLKLYFSKITIVERERVRFVSIDLYSTYKTIAQKYLPNAVICADSFHVIKNLMNAFKVVRVRVMNKYRHLKVYGCTHYWLFKKYWRLLGKTCTKLKGKKYYNKTIHKYISSVEIVDTMLSIDSELQIAYDLTQEYLLFNAKTNFEDAPRKLENLIYKFKNSGIFEFQKMANLFEHWFPKLLTLL